MTTPIEVTTSGCEFDLNGRDLSIEKLFDMAGNGFIKVVQRQEHLHHRSGKLHATGDFYKPDSYIIQGGLISLTASGTITVTNTGGTGIDVSGDGGGP